MPSFRDLSFRYKIPLRGIGLVIVTTTLLTLALVLRERQELHRDIIDGARVLGAALVHNLAAGHVSRRLRYARSGDGLAPTSLCGRPLLCYLAKRSRRAEAPGI